MEKFSLKDKIFIAIAEFVILCVIKFIYFTCKKTFSHTQLYEKPNLVVFWHQKLALMSYAYTHWWSRANKKGKVIISSHKDGEIIARIIKHFEIGAIRGSTTRGGARVVARALKDIENGIYLIITPDGPNGPKFSVSDGTIYLAQKKHLKIQVLNYEASKFWEFNSWDKMILPKPFCTINFYLSEPFDIENLQMSQAKALIKSKMFQTN